MDVYPGKADLQDFVNWVSQHVVGHASTERGRERHPPGPVMALTDFCPCRDTQITVNALVKPLISPSLLTISSSMQASSAQVLTQTLATCNGQGQSSLCTSPTSITPLSSSFNPLQASTPFLESLMFSWVLGRSPWHRLGLTPWRLSAFPWLQTDPEQGCSDIPRWGSSRLLCLP